MEATVEIKRLSASVINKIAAGEVIERPSSVVKELLENCIDAGATRIDVAIEKGGIELIRVSDNGHGIAPDQLQLAVTSHATSKIDDADDLFHVGSLGFRGEALASIAEISRFLLRSRTAADDAGYELEVNGGQMGEVSPCGCPLGTTVEIRDLFYNTPVRRRFLRTTQTEIGHIGEAFTRIALGFPHIHFTLSHNGRVLHELPVSHDLRDRIGRFFGPEIQNALIPIVSEDSGVELSGFVVDPTHSRSHNRMQYLFLNGRHIRDRSLQHALGEAYRGLLLHGRCPIAFLRMDMPAEMIDVNVHPAKLEVRFQNGGQLYSQLLGTIRRIFLTTDLTARIDPAIAGQADAAANRARDFQPDAQRNPLPSQSSHSGFDSSDRQPSPSERQQSIAFQPTQPLADPFSIGGRGSATHGSQDQPDLSLAGNPQADLSNEQSELRGDNQIPSPALPAFRAHPPQTHRPLAMQIHNRYLVTETEEGVIVIDQHALHERILYEELRKKVLAGKLEKQNLLVPEPIHLTASEAALVLEQTELLLQLGIQVEPFGGDTVLVSAYPAMLANYSPSEMVRQIVDMLAEGGKRPDRRDILDSLLHMISCKAAIKAGDRLAPEEITLLIEHRQYCQDSHHCPHGRPTALVFSREELDRRFKRI